MVYLLALGSFSVDVEIMPETALFFDGVVHGGVFAKADKRGVVIPVEGRSTVLAGQRDIEDVKCDQTAPTE